MRIDTDGLVEADIPHPHASADAAPENSVLDERGQRADALGDSELRLRKDNEELLTVVAALRRRDHEMQLLNRMIDLLQRCGEEEEAHRVIARMAPELFSGQSGHLASLRASDQSF